MTLSELLLSFIFPPLSSVRQDVRRRGPAPPGALPGPPRTDHARPPVRVLQPPAQLPQVQQPDVQGAEVPQVPLEEDKVVRGTEEEGHYLKKEGFAIQLFFPVLQVLRSRLLHPSCSVRGHQQRREGGQRRILPVLLRGRAVHPPPAQAPAAQAAKEERQPD